MRRPLHPLVVALLVLVGLALPGCGLLAPTPTPTSTEGVTMTIESVNGLDGAVIDAHAQGNTRIPLADYLPGEWDTVTFLAEGADLDALEAQYGVTISSMVRRHAGTNLLVTSRDGQLVGLHDLTPDLFAGGTYGVPHGRDAAIVATQPNALLTVEG